MTMNRSGAERRNGQQMSQWCWNLTGELKALRTIRSGLIPLGAGPVIYGNPLFLYHRRDELGGTVMRVSFDSALAGRMAAALITATAIVAMSGASAGATRNVAVVNSTRTAMVSLQVRPSGSGAWQPNVLGSRPLGVQKQVGVGVPSGSTCYYDLSAQYEDGHRKTKSHVNLCGSSKYSLSDF
jgi:hypothetical protein